MFDGGSKNVEDIKIGDKLLGPDGNQRKVIDITSGIQQMYKISNSLNLFEPLLSTKITFYSFVTGQISCRL